MLFHVSHTHTPDLCPVEDPVPVQKLADGQHIAESGVKVIGRWIAPSEHSLFFVLEASDLASVVRYLRPLMKIGTARIAPVQSIEEAIRAVKQ